ncbi:MAG: alpha/beta hydrolase family protein [Solirubrobacteraceae bacterium]
MSPPAGTDAALELETPHGLARAHLHRPAGDPRAALILGHGAGGGVGAPDLVTVTGVAVESGITVALIEQPYRVAGRRSPAPARQLDIAMISVVDSLRSGVLKGLPVITGGRSSGARVACRTVSQTGAVGVLCLAFPLLAPRRGDGERPSRLDELDAVTVPVLVIQGASDPFGMPPPGPNRAVVEVAGDHSLRKDLASVATAAGEWLAVLLAAAT